MTETEEQLLQIAAVSAYAVYSACLVGNPAPKVQSLLAALEDLRPGDWVLEISAGCWRDPENALGRLLRIDWEPVRPAEPEFGETAAPTEQVVYLETLAGQEFRWHNARFIRVFSNWEDLRAAQGDR
jgi:hypothetical protein